MSASRLVAAAGAVLLGGWASFAEGSRLEYPEVYKVPRALGMGGTDAARGGRPDALYTNPAGLAGIARGWQAAPLTITLASSRRTETFVRRLRRALDIEPVELQRDALVEVLREHRGQNLHGEGVVAPTLAWQGEQFTIGLGYLGAAKLDGRGHQGFGEAGLLEIDARSLTGPVAGLAYEHGPLRLGLAVKALRRNRVNRTYSIRELIELTQEGRDIADHREAGRDIGIDLGVQYRLRPESTLQPRLGVVVHNVGGLDFGPAGSIPQTVTLGLSLRPPITADIDGLLISVEYFDALHRLPQDGSHRKRLRAGAEWRLWRSERSSLAVRAGFYQSMPTAGIDYRLGWFRVGLLTYAEEQGAHPGQDPDRRYALSIGVEL